MRAGAVKKQIAHYCVRRGIRVDEATVTFPVQSADEVKVLCNYTHDVEEHYKCVFHIFQIVELVKDSLK